MKRVVIVDDGDTQDVHDAATGRFVELDTMIGATIVRFDRDEDTGRLTLVLEECEGDDEDVDEEG